MRRALFLKLLDGALENVKLEIASNASGGKFAAGLANEGYAGGYADALRDVDAILRHGYPSDNRGALEGER